LTDGPCDHFLHVSSTYPIHARRAIARIPDCDPAGELIIAWAAAADIVGKHWQSLIAVANVLQACVAMAGEEFEDAWRALSTPRLAHTTGQKR
jgi:hypothetical protein